MTEPTHPCPRCGAPRSASLAAEALCIDCIAREALSGVSGHDHARGAHAGPEVGEVAPFLTGYELGEVLGRGATGTVFRARHRALGRECAIKVLHAEVAARPGFQERFEREVRTLGRLSHPGIVAVLDAGRAGPWSYLVLEYVEGVDLRQLMRAERIAPREALAIVAGLCEALQYAHDQGVVHRDIKPENVLVDRAGRVRILDFGLARLTLGDDPGEALTRTGQVVGTPLYMAPEQWRAPLAVDHRADIYALGVVLYELLTGELPVGRFPAPSQRVAVDVRLDEVVLRALEREPERRYQSARAVGEELAAAAPPDTAPADDPQGASADAAADDSADATPRGAPAVHSRAQERRKRQRLRAAAQRNQAAAHGFADRLGISRSPADRPLRVALWLLAALCVAAALAVLLTLADDRDAERSIPIQLQSGLPR